MKKWISCLLMFALICAVVSVPTFAAPATETAPASRLVSETVEMLPDGGKIVTTVYEDIPSSDASVAATTYTKTGSKTRTSYTSSGAVTWTFTVHGTFSVTSGVSATCTAASYSYTTPGSGWSLKTASTSKSGNKATGNATFVRKVLLVTVETDNATLTLTCSSNGTFS